MEAEDKKEVVEGSCHLFCQVGGREEGGFHIAHLVLSVEFCCLVLWLRAAARFRSRCACVSVRTHTFPVDWQP